MSPIPAEPAPAFDRLAHAYRWMEWASFGPFLGLCRSTFLPRLTHCRSALVLGDGDGRFTAKLLRTIPSIHVHAVDSSPAMLAVLTRTCGQNAASLTTQHADIRTWQRSPRPTTDPTLLYDLVVTHFFLDCLSTDEILAPALRLKPILFPGALWVVSEFAVPPGWFGRLVAGPIVRGLYLAFGLLTGLRQRTLPDYASALSAAGFKRLERRSRLGGLLVSELWQTTASSSTLPPA
jgi:SAM-dependent methyltransferase